MGADCHLSDGDVVFNPARLNAPDFEAVEWHVLIYIHKEQALDDVGGAIPQHYVLVDDKPRILAAVKEAWGDRVTTVFPRQGRYARDTKALASCHAGGRDGGPDRRPLDYNWVACLR